jgi:hypothetical protein
MTFIQEISGVNLPTYDISLIDSCKLLLSYGKVLQCVLKTFSCFLESNHIFNFWDDKSEYSRSVMLSGCFITYFIDCLILSFSV